MTYRALDRLLQLLVLAPLGALLILAACGKASPVAPTGAILTVSVNPAHIASSTGTAAVTATLHRANGTPDQGVQIQFSSTLGTVNPSFATTSSNGVATATLTGDGRVGAAKLTASSGAITPVTVDVTIGTVGASVALSANPANVSFTHGGVINLVALVRDDQGQPLPNSPVNFSSQVGSLRSGGGFVFTGPDGAARDVLTVGTAELNALPGSGDSFDVTVQGGAASAATAKFTIGVLRPPVASFTFTPPPAGIHTVAFTDTSTHHPTQWSWSFGDGSPTSSSQNPAHTYAAAGTYTVTLTATNSEGSSSSSQVVTIS
jgi:PKD repeat protein